MLTNGIDEITLFIGNVIHCSKKFRLECFENGFLAVQNEKIIEIGDASRLNVFKTNNHSGKINEILLKKSQILIPGLIDTHIHASQYPNVGLGLDKTLLQWLDAYTFPLEMKFKDVGYAEKVYTAVVKQTLANGTTTACYFATLHENSSLKLVDVVEREGQRALVGKVNMTRLCPKELQETHKESVANTLSFVQNVIKRNNSLVRPIVTPRFALSCDTELMKELASIAKDYDVHIQTHISETKDEISTMKELFGNFEYANVYDMSNLLTPKTILAHGVHLTPLELQLIASKKSSVSHCPRSNTCLQSGICNVREIINAGIAVGLGTDVSGGPSPSILDAMRSAMDASIHLKFADKNYVPLSYQDVFYLATLGGATALSMDKVIGNFDIGKEFDALVVNMDVGNSGTDYLKPCDILELLQKFIYTGNDRNIEEVYVAGTRVK